MVSVKDLDIVFNVQKARVTLHGLEQEAVFSAGITASFVVISNSQANWSFTWLVKRKKNLIGNSRLQPYAICGARFPSINGYIC